MKVADLQSGAVRSIVGETINISAGGLALQLAVELPLGAWVETLVLHPSGESMFLSGNVVHVRQTLSSQYEIGVAMNREGTHTVF